MILTDYYKGENLPGNARSRIDVTASTGSYEPFEQKLRNKKGEQFYYLGDVPDRFKFTRKDPPDKAITKGHNISSVFVPDPALPYGFGDIHQTSDAALFIYSNNWQVIEIFIARGQRNNKRNIYTLLCDKQLDHEIETLRNQAKK